MNSALLTFTVNPGRAALASNGQTAAEISFEDGKLSVNLFYDVRKDPLRMEAPASNGDSVRIELLPYRVSLFIRDKLADENWPIGNLPLDGAASDGDMKIIVSTLPEKTDAPAILRSGLDFPEIRMPGVNIGDCMPFSYGDDGRYHLFWLYDRHHHCSKWGLGAHQWAHASTTDFRHWDEHQMAIPITDQIEGSICTGSTIRNADGAVEKFSSWYAVRMSDGSPARMTRSASDDCIHWHKTGEFFTLPDRYHGPSARDPKAVHDGGKYHLLITTSLTETGEGCLAHLVSDHSDMRDFTDLGPVLRTKLSTRPDGSTYYEQPECPDWFAMGDYYYLVWSEGGRARYAFAKTPFGDEGWTIPDDNIIDCGNVPKSALCPWNGERVFIGFVPEGGYAGSAVAARTIQAPDGTLGFEKFTL